MIEKNGDLFTTDAGYIGHGVNCFGKMGSGIAVQFRNRFRRNYTEYVRACERKSLNPGDAFLRVDMDVVTARRFVVVNLASQFRPGPDATYLHLFQSLENWAKQARLPHRIESFGNVLAIPEIGCGIGGLEWDKAKTVIQAVEYIYPEIEFEVWHYDADV
jgi:O-acetyl-ADP-ribose deacetylase (regulator of RNase III)